MIRRAFSNNRFLLIPQTEHARIASEFAQAWHGSGFLSYPYLSELQFAIRHHDDGWDEWENTADFTPETGLPRNFTEMDSAPSIDIWQRCIHICRQHSQRCGYWVSQHFSALARQRLQSLDATAADEVSIMQSFVRQQQNIDNQTSDAADADVMTTGTMWLQFFDRLSLLVCCRLPTESDVILQPDKTPITIEQTQRQNRVSVTLDIEVTPMTLTVNGRLYETSSATPSLDRLPTGELQLSIE